MVAAWYRTPNRLFMEMDRSVVPLHVCLPIRAVIANIAGVRPVRPGARVVYWPLRSLLLAGTHGRHVELQKLSFYTRKNMNGGYPQVVKKKAGLKIESSGLCLASRCKTGRMDCERPRCCGWYSASCVSIPECDCILPVSCGNVEVECADCERNNVGCSGGNRGKSQCKVYLCAGGSRYKR